MQKLILYKIDLHLKHSVWWAFNRITTAATAADPGGTGRCLSGCSVQARNHHQVHCIVLGQSDIPPGDMLCVQNRSFEQKCLMA